MTDKIGGVIVTAPLWNGAEPHDLRQIVAWLSSASYHFADDSGKEWISAYKKLDAPVKAVNRLRLGFHCLSVKLNRPGLPGLKP